MTRFLALLCLACAPLRVELAAPQADFPAALVFEEDFAYREEVEEAARFWNAQARRELFTSDYARAQSVVAVVYEERNPEDPASPGNRELAVTRGGLAIAFFDGWRRSTEADQVTVARHELGHVLGFLHVYDPGCLMYPVIVPSDAPRGLCDAERAALRGAF